MSIAVSMVATPSFVLLSGMVVGLLWCMEPQRLPALRRKLIDRGLFLLVIGHPLQAFAYGPTEELGAALRVSFITDVIAVAIIVGPTIVLLTSSRTRFGAGLMMLMVSWNAGMWAPHSALAIAFDRYVLGGSFGREFVGFSVIPWLGVYLMGTSLGELIGVLGALADPLRIAQMTRRCGLVISTTGLALVLSRRLSSVLWPTLIARHRDLWAFLSPAHKFPPGPVFLLCFGGAALILMSLPFALEGEARFGKIMRILAMMGRASFFVFVLQAYLYFVLLPWMNLPHPSLWPLYYAASIGLIIGASTVWDHFEANRYLTVGLWRAVPLLRRIWARIRVLREPIAVRAVPPTTRS